LPRERSHPGGHFAAASACSRSRLARLPVLPPTPAATTFRVIFATALGSEAVREFGLQEATPVADLRPRTTAIGVGRRLLQPVFYDIEFRRLEFLGIDRLIVLAVAQAAMGFQIDRIGDRLNRTVAKRHVKTIGMGAAKSITVVVAGCVLN